MQIQQTANSWIYDHGIPSEPDFCAKVVGLVLEQLEKTSWENRDIFGIHMAVEEAIMNAIRHGNACNPKKQVQIFIEITETAFYSRVTDQGCGFNPQAIPDPTDEENLEKSSGRGVMLMRSFVDRVTYNDDGNSVELFKTRS